MCLKLLFLFVLIKNNVVHVCDIMVIEVGYTTGDPSLRIGKGHHFLPLFILKL